MVQVGPRGLRQGFHLDTRNIGTWQVYKGWIPYGPWSIKYPMTPPVEWEIDGETILGGTGPWAGEWANYSLYPNSNQWPGHERWFNLIHAPLPAENTIHQITVHAGLSYGFVNSRSYTNAAAAKSISTITLSEGDITFTKKKEYKEITATVDESAAVFGQLKWESSDSSVAHVDKTGRVTAVANGTCEITCSTLDGGVSAKVTITNDNLADVPVEGFSVYPKPKNLDEGQSLGLTVSVLPEIATNPAYKWETSDESVMTIEDGILTAISEGLSTISVIAVENESVKESFDVEVLGAGYNLLLDFDTTPLPSTEARPDSIQFFKAGTSTLEFTVDNPSKSGMNKSEKVAKFSKSADQWQLFGVVFPTDDQPLLCQYQAIQFKYYGTGINKFQVEATDTAGVKYQEIFEVKGADTWQLLSFDLPNEGVLKQVIVFVNTDEVTEATVYLDDFRLKNSANPTCFPNEKLLDFEAIKLDWQGGYGAFAWNSNKALIADNPLKNSGNSSKKVFKWERDGNNQGGGFGIGIPVTKPGTWATMSFDIMSNKAVGDIRIELKKVVDDETLEEGFVELKGLNLAGNEWHKVSFPLETLDSLVGEFNQIVMVPALGTSTVQNIYVDNILLKDIRKEPLAIGDKQRTTFNIYPNPSTGKLNIVGSIGIQKLEVLTISGKVVKSFEGSSTGVLDLSDLQKGIYFIRAINNQSETEVRKVILK